MNPVAPCRVLAISDGAAGNENQAVALAQALGVEPVVLRLSARAPWRWIAPRRLPGVARAFGAEFAHWLKAEAGDVPSLAIGCGRQAALATRLLRESGDGAWASVQILDPRIALSHYDLVIAPRHDGLAGDNLITTLGGLNRIDDAWLEQARAAFPALGALPAPRHAVLLGGPTRALRLDQGYWRELEKTLRVRLERDGGSLMLTSSRRTPDWLRAAAREAFAGVPGIQWHGAGDGANPYAGMLGWADVLVVTPDSVNMLSEAAATRAELLTLAPQPVRGKVGRFVAELERSGRLRFMHEKGPVPPIEPLRESARVAALVAQRLGWMQAE